MSKGIQIAIGGSVILLLLAWYGLSNLDRFQYFQNLGAYLNSAEVGKPVRIHGYVAAGSIERDLENKFVRFSIQETPPHATDQTSEHRLAIRYDTLELPDLFKDGAEVVVEGHLSEKTDPTGNQEFEASNVLAKCPSKFEGKETEEAPF